MNAAFKNALADVGAAVDQPVFGIGIDTVRTERIARIWERSGELLAQSILLDEELALFRGSDRYVEFLTLRIAAKEAIVKAMGTGFAEGIWFRDVGFLPGAAGRPEPLFSARGLGKCRELGIGRGYLTLAATTGRAFAFALLTRAS